jgi:DNA-binding MarR family transcriptional regulator
MEKRGLAVRVPDPVDRRKSNIFLTRPAKDLRELLLREAREVNRTATAGISAAEIETLKSILTKIRKNLSPPVEIRRASPAPRDVAEAE